MNSVFDIINVPLGYLFKGLYYLVGNYGWTIILFTVVSKVILFPLTVKQQKSMKKTQAIQPVIAQLQEKYKYDQEKCNQEIMKLYQKAGVNPMGGCLPTLIQFPILIALYNIIRKPMSYVMMLSKDVIGTIYERVNGTVLENFAQLNQIELANQLKDHLGSLGDIITNHDLLNFNFFGLNLSVTPSISFISQNLVYIIIPLAAGLTTFLVSHISTKMSGTSATENSQAPNMKAMTYFFPLMTAWFSITLPAGLGLYWTVSNLFQIVQMFVLNKQIEVEAPVEVQGPKHYRERKKKKK